MKIRKKSLVFNFYMVKVESRGLPRKEIKEFIEKNDIICGRSDEFMQFAGSDSGQSFATEGELFEIWGDSDEFRKTEGLRPDQRVEGITTQGEPPYRLLYAPSVRNEYLSMDDAYEGTWIFCAYPPVDHETTYVFPKSSMLRHAARVFLRNHPQLFTGTPSEQKELYGNLRKRLVELAGEKMCSSKAIAELTGLVDPLTDWTGKQITPFVHDLVKLCITDEQFRDYMLTTYGKDASIMEAYEEFCFGYDEIDLNRFEVEDMPRYTIPD